MYSLYNYERELDNQFIADYLELTVDEMFEKCEQLNCEPDELVKIIEKCQNIIVFGNVKDANYSKAFDILQKIRSK